jgi:hypothetical protein
MLVRIVAFLLACLPLAQATERWVYIPANYLVPAQVERVTGLLKRARAAGYTHALLTDSKFSRLDSLPEKYFDHVKAVKATAQSLGIELVPGLFGVGYSNDLLSNDPNLAEGLPVKDALFVVKDDIAALVPEPEVALKKKWSLKDESIEQVGDSYHSKPSKKNARISQAIALHPWRQYHISVSLKTAGFQRGKPEIKVIADGKQLQWTDVPFKADQKSQTVHLTFNSLEHTAANIYFGVWGGHEGELWWDKPQLEECALVNVLRRPGAPFVVKTEEGRVLKEGEDYQPFRCPSLGTVPYGGEYLAWHEPVALHTKAMPDGTRLRISYYHPHVIYEGQVCACVSEPAFQNLLQKQAQGVHKLWSAHSYMMQHDEWRVMNYCQACQSRKMTPGQIAAGNVSQCQQWLRDAAPASRTFVWSDMFDPHHNAIDNTYYLVNGPLNGSWTGLEKNTIIVNWNQGEKAAESLQFFSKRGHSQLIAGYYDQPLDHTRNWLRKVKPTHQVIGVMYTTWQNNYEHLEAYAEMLKAEGY